MGTVPDPLRSARLSLVTASEEEKSLRELQSPKHQHKSASLEKSSNGFPFAAKVPPAGACLLDMNLAMEVDVPKSERHCGYDACQPTTCSPGSLSPSRENCLTASEPVTEQGGSDGSKAKKQAVVEDSTAIPGAVRMPATQEVHETTQRDIEGQLGRPVDKESAPAGEGRIVQESKACDLSSPSAPSNAQRTAAATKEDDVGAKTSPNLSPEKTLKESEGIAALEVQSCFALGAELKGAQDASSHTGTVLETRSQSKLDSNAGAKEKAEPDLSKFKDTGTMTVQPEGAASRVHQDAGVQAVASMESKAASTSPSIFAAFLRENRAADGKQRHEEQLHVIYTGAGGKEQSEIVDRFVPLVQTAPSTGIMPEAHMQTPATADTLGGQAVKLHSDPAGTVNPTHSALSDDAKCPWPPESSSPQDQSGNRVEAQVAGVASNCSNMSPQPLDTSILLKTRPVYQITVNPSSASVVPLQPAHTETNLPPTAALPEFNSKHGGACGTENIQIAPSSQRVSEQAEVTCLTVDVHSSHHKEQPQFKTVSSLETSPVSLPIVVKPKRGEKPSLDCEGQEAMNTRPKTTCSPVTMKGQVPEDGKEAKAPGNQTVAIGLESDLGKNSGPSLKSQVAESGESNKRPKCDTSAVLASARCIPNLGVNKKEPKLATDAKIHLKQSKRVRDVVWDEQGMTWEVYGASLDPESLGIAIQNHLQRQIREHEKLIKAQNTQNRKSISSETSSNKKLKGRQPNVFQSMLQNFRHPNCCVRPAASSVLD